MSILPGIDKLVSTLIPDKEYISWKYQRKMGRPVSWDNPQTFTEKIQWLKLYWRPEILTQCSDKYEVRRFVEERVGPEILNTLYGVYNKVEQIDPKELPDSFILKVTHGSGRHMVCKTQGEIDWKQTRRLFKQYLRGNQYYYGREWGYKNILPRIICEKYLWDAGEILYDYKFYCFNGIPRFVEIASDVLGSPQVNMFDLNLNLMERKYKTRALEQTVERPAHFDTMTEYAVELSRGFPFVRVDLLYIKQHIYFGEMTFYPLSGIVKYNPVGFDEFLGTFLQLPTEKKVSG